MTNHPPNAAAAPDPLLELLARAAEGLFITSETDSPLTPFRWPDFFADKSDGQNIVETLRRFKNLPADAAVETISLEQFFKPQIAPDKFDDAETAEEKRRLAALRDLLLKELPAAAVYRTGKINVAAYVLGRVPGTNNAAGVSTELVET